MLFKSNENHSKRVLLFSVPFLFLFRLLLKSYFPNFLVKLKQKLSHQCIHEETIEFLNTLSTCLLAGLNLKQALEKTLEEEKMNGLIKNLITQVINKVSFGESLFDSMMSVHLEAKDVANMKYFSLSLYLLAKTQNIGGNLTNTIKQLKDKINFKIVHVRKMKISTAQMRLQAWIISLAPCILAFILWFVSPNYILIFFDSALGLIILTIMVVLNISGSYILIQIANKLVIE